MSSSSYQTTINLHSKKFLWKPKLPRTNGKEAEPKQDENFFFFPFFLLVFSFPRSSSSFTYSPRHLFFSDTIRATGCRLNLPSIEDSRHGLSYFVFLLVWPGCAPICWPPGGDIPHQSKFRLCITFFCVLNLFFLFSFS